MGAIWAPMLWAVKRFALTVSLDGLECRPPWKPGRFLRWEEVESVSYSEQGFFLSPHFTIGARDKWKFRVPIDVPGLSEFLAQCEQHLPAESLVNSELGYFRLNRPFPEMIAMIPGRATSSAR